VTKKRVGPKRKNDKSNVIEGVCVCGVFESYSIHGVANCAWQRALNVFFLSCKTQNKINKKSRFSPSATSVSQGPHLWRKGTWLTLFDYGDRITKLSLSHGILAATKSTQSVTEQPEKVKKKKSTSFFFSFGGSIRSFTLLLLLLFIPD
jgi:hypothetical protein